MYYSKDIEGFGTGLKKIADECEAADVRYEFKKKKLGFSVVFYREKLSVDSDETGSQPNDGINDELILSAKQRALIAIIKESPSATAYDIAATLGVKERQVERIRKDLRDKGIIRHVGANRSGYWEITLRHNEGPP